MSQQEAIRSGGIPCKAHPLGRVHELSLRPVTLLDHQSAVHDGVSGGLLMTALIYWKVCVEKVPHPCDHAIASDRIVAAAAFRAIGLGNGVGAVEGVVKAAPSCIGGV